MARKTSKPTRPVRRAQLPSEWQIVPVKMQKSATPVVRAIAAAQTEYHEAPAGEPWTTDQVLQEALQRGLRELERLYLGTDVLDEVEPPPLELDQPEARASLARALVKALGRQSMGEPADKR